MNLVLRVFLLINIIATSFEAAPWLFVKPILKDPSVEADLSNIEFIKEEGMKVLLFEIDSRPELAKVAKLLDQSKMIEWIHSWRMRARQKHFEKYGFYASADDINTPYLTVVGDIFGKGGPAVGSLRVLLKDRGIRTNSILILAPIGLTNSQITLEDFVSENYLAPLIGHEFFHGIMGDIYANRMLEMKARSLSNVGHQADRVTDEYLAFIEGIAEAMELATLELFPDEVNHKLISAQSWPEEKRNLFGQIKFRRLVAARHNHLGLLHDGHLKDGELDSAQELFKTEGVVATLIYQLMFKSGLEGAFEKIIDVMVAHKPMTFIDFLKALLVENPTDSEKIIRQFLEVTRYITVSDRAAASYQKYYLAARNYKKGELVRKEFDLIARSWSEERAELLKKVLAGELALDRTIIPVFGVKDENGYFDFNLNSADSDLLYSFFTAYFGTSLSEDEIVRHVGLILRMLDSKTFITSPDSLPFSEEIKAEFAKFHDEHVAYYETLVELRLERLMEYSSWITWTKEIRHFTDAYKIHSGNF